MQLVLFKYDLFSPPLSPICNTFQQPCKAITLSGNNSIIVNILLGHYIFKLSISVGISLLGSMSILNTPTKWEPLRCSYYPNSEVFILPKQNVFWIFCGCMNILCENFQDILCWSCIIRVFNSSLKYCSSHDKKWLVLIGYEPISQITYTRGAEVRNITSSHFGFISP